jgi:hypothetical protein
MMNWLVALCRRSTTSSGQALRHTISEEMFAVMSDSVEDPAGQKRSMLALQRRGDDRLLRDGGRFDRTPRSFDSHRLTGFDWSPSWLLAKRVIGIIVSTLPLLRVGPLFRLPEPFGRIDPVPVWLELRAVLAALLNFRTRHVGDVATLLNPGSLILFTTRSVDLRLLAALTALLDFGLGAYDRVGDIARLPCPLVPTSFRRPRVRPGYLLLSAPTAMPVSAFVPRPFTIMPIMINFEREDHHRQSD